MQTKTHALCTAAALFAMLLSPVVTAGETHLVLNGRSYHIDSSYDWNENNAGLGVEFHF